MKLTVNKEHRRGNFKKKFDQVSLKVGAIAVSAAIFSGASSLTVDYIQDLEKIVSVSADVRNSMYHNNKIFDIDDYNPYKEVEVEDGLIKKQYINTNIDKNITKESFSNIKTLNIDLLKTEDLSFLKYCTNLKNLSIDNALLLTEQQVNIINSCNIEQLSLLFNVNDLTKIDINKLQLKNLKNKNILISILTLGELQSQILYTLMKELPDNFSSLNLNYELCKNNDDKMDYLLSKIDFSDTKNESDKAMKILECVLKYIKYDEEISEYTDNNGNIIEGSIIDEKVKYYNTSELSSVLSSENDEAIGVCVNYSSLFSMMCLKMGIECHVIDGSYTDSTYGHAWCLIKVDGEYKYVDVTHLDTCYFDSPFYDMYLLGGNKLFPKEFYWEHIKKDVYQDIDTDIFTTEEDIEKIKQSLNTTPEVIWYNKDVEGTYVNNTGINPLKHIVIGYNTGLIVAIISKGIIKKKEKSLSQ